MEQLYPLNALLDTAFKQIKHDDLSLEMKKYAEDHDVPIIDDSGLETILQFLNLKKPLRVLEIGSAIGYWSTMIARHTGAAVTTIERDAKHYELAQAFVERAKLGDQIQLHHADALAFDVAKLHGDVFDVIFIDAAKSAYQRFFEKYEPFLAPDGLVISDNLLFHGHIFSEPKSLGQNLRDLTRKIKTYSAWLAEHPHYQTVFLPLGDGIAFSYRQMEVREHD